MTVSATADRFLALIRPSRRCVTHTTPKDGCRRCAPRDVTENEDFVAMLWRQVRALEARAIEDPQMLPQVLALAQRLSEVANVAIATNAARYGVDPRRGASMMECARTLGITKQSASDRRKVGERIIGERLDAAGAIRFSEAARERAAIARASAYAQQALTEYRARRAA